MKRFATLLTVLILVVLALPISASATTAIKDGWNETHTKYGYEGKWYKGLLYEGGYWYYLKPSLAKYGTFAMKNKVSILIEGKAEDYKPFTVTYDFVPFGDHPSSTYVNHNGKTYTYKQVNLSGKTIFSDPAGHVNVNGWVTKRHARYYTEYGFVQKGPRIIKGKTYYFDKNGKMKTGWLTMNKNTLNSYPVVPNIPISAYPTRLCSTEYGKAKKYYFNKKTGAMVTGFTTINGKLYYFYDPDSGVKMTYCGLKGGVGNSDRAPMVSDMYGVRSVNGSMFVNGYIEMKNGTWYKVSSSGVCRKTTKPNYKWSFIK